MSRIFDLFRRAIWYYDLKLWRSKMLIVKVGERGASADLELFLLSSVTQQKPSHVCEKLNPLDPFNAQTRATPLIWVRLGPIWGDTPKKVFDCYGQIFDDTDVYPRGLWLAMIHGLNEMHFLLEIYFKTLKWRKYKNSGSHACPLTDCLKEEDLTSDFL